MIPFLVDTINYILIHGILSEAVSTSHTISNLNPAL